MIQVLFNSLPQAEVRGTLENTIVVTPKMWGKNEKINLFVISYSANYLM
jgi:hypothetical protein